MWPWIKIQQYTIYKVLLIQDTKKLKVKVLKKIYHVNKHKKAGAALLISDKRHFKIICYW